MASAPNNSHDAAQEAPSSVSSHGSDADRSSGSLRLLAIAVWLLIWQLVSRVVGSQLLLAGPVETLICLARLASTLSFWSAILFSLLRVGLGFVAAFALALGLAPLARTSQLAREIIFVGLGAVKSVPVVCIVVLLLMLVGSRNVSIVAVFLVALPALFFAAYEALCNLDPHMEELLSACKQSAWRRTFGHVWPSMHPFLLAVCKNAVGMSWKAGVAAELIGMPLGSIGERIYQTKLLLETGELFAWTIVLVVLAALSEQLFLRLLTASRDYALHLATQCQQSTPVHTSAQPAASVELRNVSVSFDAEKVIDNLSFALEPGARVCLGDPSGAGKTTLLRLVAGICLPDTGSVIRSAVDGPAVSYMSQVSCLLESVSAVDNVAFLAGDWLDAKSIRALLAQLLDDELLDKPVRELSGGQRRRVELVRTLARPSGLVLLDEPFASLDVAGAQQAAAFVLRELNGRTLIVASHLKGTEDMLDARRLSLKASSSV